MRRNTRALKCQFASSNSFRTSYRVLENTTVVALDVDNANSLQNLIQVFNAQKIQVFSLLVN